MKSMRFKRMCLLAGAMVISAVANAFYYDATVTIDRALNSPTLTVRYNGAVVALVELRVNGVSVGTRTITSIRNAGETNFTLDLGSLKDGDNEVEVRLFDKAGKLVGSEKSSVTTDTAAQGPVFLSTPKVGATVQGPVQIKVGFGRELRNVYVSFFVDNQFKSMINYPPYDYTWDTARESNGWHEVEAWVVDDSSTTFKTKRVKVFVNNPSGNTVRPSNPPTRVEGNPIGNPVHPSNVSGGTTHLKGTPNGAGSTPAGSHPTVAEPKTTGIERSNPLRVAIGPSTGSKGTRIPGAVAAGPRFLTPTGTRVASVPSTAINSAAHMVQINYGQRLPNMPTYAIILDSKYVDFDVSPRVQNGVPLTPFRHLLESAGGEVNWNNALKEVDASAKGKAIWIKIGDRYAKVDKLPVELELAPFIEKGRTVVPLSFMKSTLNVDIQYDPTTGHVLITSKKK